MAGPAILMGFVVVLIVAARLMLHGERRPPVLPVDPSATGRPDPWRRGRD